MARLVNIYEVTLKANTGTGKRRIPYQCALATALKDKYNVTRLHVTNARISFTDVDTGERLTWDTTYAIGDWISKWDKKQKGLKDLRVKLSRTKAEIVTLEERRERRAIYKSDPKAPVRKNGSQPYTVRTR